MSLDVMPGSKVRIKVSKTPTNEAAAKTLSRIFAKNLTDRGARRRRRALRQSEMRLHRRGGRPWAYLPQAPRLFQPTKDAACTVLVTPDLLGDLRSVARFIQVEPV
jgi:hypothetical protein